MEEALKLCICKINNVSCFHPCFQVFQSPLCTLACIFWNQALANSIFFSKFEVLDPVWTLEVGLVEWFCSGRDGWDSWAWQMKKRTRTVCPLTHPETVWMERASHFSLESTPLVCSKLRLACTCRDQRRCADPSGGIYNKVARDLWQHKLPLSSGFTLRLGSVYCLVA